jgi:K+-sensing histidine kinase KdpD
MLADGEYLHMTSSDSESREILEEVVGSVNLMHRMVLDLLDTDRAADGKLEPRFSWSTAADVLGAAGKLALARARSSGHTLAISVPEGELPVSADQDLLRRVLDNLVDNAFKYTPKGGRIELGAAGEREGMCFWVGDEGPGIPEAARASIFQPYVRLDRDVQTADHSSRGLGLAFCRVAIEAMGGTIQVEALMPRGARFVVRLPPGKTDA